jgi:transposase
MSKKSEGEAASMFDDEDFDAAYRGTSSSHMPTNSPDDDDDDLDDAEELDDEEAYDEEESEPEAVADEEPEDDEAAWEEAQRAPLPPEDVEDDVEAEDEDTLTAETDDDNDEDDDDAEVSAARDILATRSPEMAKNTKMIASRGTGATKSDMIRTEIAKRQESGDSLRAKDIIATLAKRGVEVNASQVSVTLRNMGVAPTRGPNAATPAAKPRVAAKVSTEGGEAPRRGRTPRTTPAAETTTHRAKKVALTRVERVSNAARECAAGSFTLAELRHTRDFLAAIGNRERAIELFDAVAEFSQS